MLEGYVKWWLALKGGRCGSKRTFACMIGADASDALYIQLLGKMALTRSHIKARMSKPRPAIESTDGTMPVTE